MAQFSIEEIQSGTVHDSSGDKVGKVGQLYLDDSTGDPNFVTVKTGLLGGNESFVPLDGARIDGDEIHVPYTKDVIKDAPNIDEDGHIDPAQEEEIYRYYGLDGAGADGHAGVGGDGGADGAAGDGGADGHAGVGGDGGADGAAGTAAAGTAAAGTAAATRGDGGADGHAGVGGDGGADGHAGVGGDGGADGHAGVGGDGGADGAAGDGAAGDSVVRREEEVRVGTERVQTGRVRLRKHVVTDTKTVEVPVEREEVEVVREPIADGGRGGDLAEGEAEVTLSEDRPVVEKEVVDKERVGLGKTTVQDTERVQTDVSREEVDIVEDGDGTGRA